MKAGQVILDPVVISTFKERLALEEVVAQTWVIASVPIAPLLRGGATPMEGPMKDWRIGCLVVLKVSSKGVVGLLRRTATGYFLVIKEV